MFKYFGQLIFISFLFLQCREKNKSSAVTAATTDTSAFFPVNNFIKEDIKDEQQNPYHLYKIIHHPAGSRDSSTISVDEFVRLAGDFISKDITASLKPLFRESVYHDLTTKSITIDYTAIDSQSDIQNVTVLLDDKTNKLKRVFIRSSYTKGDSVFMEQHNWKAGKSFRIITSVRIKNSAASETETTVIWNDKPFD